MRNNLKVILTVLFVSAMLIANVITSLGEMPVETLAIMCISQVCLKTLYEIIILPFTNLTVRLVNKFEKI